ncbi:MAG: Hsp20/alpha crystallin family protein [Phycisphaerales bacterium]|nr:Hsp20/alpha crystallin family protein [Phycisphaerales bacterium]
MFLTRTNTPLVPFRRMQREFEELARELTSAFGGNGEDAFPAVNVADQGDTLLAEVELPGMKLDGIDVSVERNYLTIKGQRKFENKSDDAVWRRRERREAQFARTVELPCEVKADKAEATLRDGVLTVILPKTPAAQSRRVSVKAG